MALSGCNERIKRYLEVSCMDVKGKTTALKKLRESIETASGSARKRLAMLFDEGTFVEIGAFVKQRPSEFGVAEAAAEGVVTGYGSVNGVLVFAFAQDPSVLKGSISEMNAKKICNLAEMALKADAPIVSMIDTCGVRLLEGVDALSGYGKILKKFNKVAGSIFHISIVFGVSAGAMSFLPALADYTIVLKDSEIFLSSPDVVRARFNDGKAGTAAVAYERGLASLVCKTEGEAVKGCKEFINFVCSPAKPADDINRLVPEISKIIAKDGYNMLDVIKSVADEGKVFEMYSGCAGNLVTAIIKLGGFTVGVIGNQPKVRNGILDTAAAKKAAKFIDFCEFAGISLLSLVDTNGYDPDPEENIEDIVLQPLSFINAEVPKITLIIGKAYGAGYVSMCSKTGGSDLVLAYPTAQIACLPAESGAVFMSAQTIVQTNADPVEEREQLIAQYRNTIASPYEAAKHGYVDDIIEIQTTRQLLISSFDMLSAKIDTEA